MTLKNLLLDFPQENILKRLVKLYPDQKKNLAGYNNVLNELSNLEPKLNKMQILIVKCYDEFDKKYHFHVYGIDTKQEWAIEFEPWENWLGMEINKKTLNIFSKIDIICHSLWEMTYFGFSNKKIKKEKDKLLKRVKKEKK